MTDETESLMLDILRAVRGDIARIERKVDEHTVRVGRIEVALAGLHRDVAHHDEGRAEQSVRLDRLNASIERLERRLELS
jgi:septal ring factor EnvC (AmiA/AmiB activator)